MRRNARIGTAGWGIPKQHASAFPSDGSHLARYADRFSAVEINSSFYRSHRPATYARWASSVPPDFKFAVKIPKTITHKHRLLDISEPLKRFLDEVEALGSTLGPLLVQLPPSTRYDADVVGKFFELLRQHFEGYVVCEPRHATWFTGEVDAQLAAFHIARVGADPALVPQAASPAGWCGISYRRLHGSPKIYYSPYSVEALAATAELLQDDVANDRETWCIFDNTALGEATRDAITLLQPGLLDARAIPP
ncbi:DUF72 domain-containing protein [Falsiroseomonas sp. E2-1-a20]|uniref:DUF72 domain-containing protein n=1 Tax=Falsiroseomonas sp. E2-1-a20 TaxID=3239300 RepID=UPI003F31383E